MLIAKITKSNSHVDYFARVLDSLETSVNLSPADFQFGQFVKINVGEEEVVGVIYNSLLINSHVETMSDDEVRAFHYGGRQVSGGLQAHYYSHVMTHAGLFAFQLLSAIVDQLERLADEQDRARLDVVRKALAWRQTIGKMG